VLQRRGIRQLDSMQNYARWERCRRRQILEYFGEAKIPENCSCDVCGARSPKLKMTGRAAELARSGDKEQGPSQRQGHGQDQSQLPHVSQKVANAGHPAVMATEDFRLARLKEVRRDVVRALGTIFFQHLPDELLRRLIASPPRTVAELKDEFEVHNKIVENFGMRIVHVASAGKEQRQEQRQGQLPHVSRKMANVGHPDASVEARSERLRTLRLRLARARGWRAFQILHDSTLLEVARRQPRTIPELMEIKGIGDKKAAEFGKELLAEVARG
jgi:ATP-dependent DNA helicase RecQ